MNLDEALNPDLIGALPDGRMTLPKPAFELVHAAAREFNQNADSVNSEGVSSGGVELARLREALEWWKSHPEFDETNAQLYWFNSIPIIAAARRFLALTETGRRVDFCTTHGITTILGRATGECGYHDIDEEPCHIRPMFLSPFDAALADYLTEEDRES